jgi:hypothetical protein
MSKEASAEMNHLRGWKCPECGNDEEFSVVVGGWVTLRRAGWDTRDITYGQDSEALCVRCDHTGVVRDFAPQE